MNGKRNPSMRMKRCSIEAARKSAGDTPQSVAERLGMTIDSLKAHLQRTKATRRKSAK